MVNLPLLKSASADTDGTRDAYVHTAVLSGVDDVYNPDMLWSAPTAFRWGRRSLKSIIDSMRCRFGNGEQVPVSVVLELPAEKMERDRRIGGQLTHELTAVLSQRHSRDFKDCLPPGMQPRYAVHAAHDVPAGHVRVRLGPAIHVPQQDEAAIWKIQTSLDGVVWDSAAPIILTEYQRLFILSGSVEHGSQVCKQWPFDVRLGLVFLNLPGESRLDLSSEPLGGLNVSWNDAADCHVVRVPDAGPDEPCLYIKAVRLQPVAVPSLPSRTQVPIKGANFAARASAGEPQAAVATSATQEGEGEGVAGAGAGAETADRQAKTEAPGLPEPAVLSGRGLAPAASPQALAVQAAIRTGRAEPALADAPTLMAIRPAARIAPLDDVPTLMAVRPVRSASISLEGLAVQRPSLFTVAGVRGVQWGLDAQGGVVAPQAANCVLRFTVTAEDELRVATASGSRLLRPGEAVPLKGGDIVLRLQAMPPPLDENYLGWLQLPLGRPAPIEYGKCLGVGRQLQSLRPVQPMAGTGFLVDVPETGGDCMGLSRKHFELQATAEGLVVRALGSNTVAHLSKDMDYLGKVSADQPALLADGQCLVVGHYVWRFNA